MFCTNCGKKIDDDARFCSSCGAATKLGKNLNYKEGLDNTEKVNSNRVIEREGIAEKRDPGKQQEDVFINVKHDNKPLSEKVNNTKKKRRKSNIFLIGIGVVVLLVLAINLIAKIKKTSKFDPIVYVAGEYGTTERCLYAKKNSESKPIELFSFMGSSSSMRADCDVRFSRDKSKVLFRINNYDNEYSMTTGISLYYVDLKNFSEKTAPVAIYNADVSEYDLEFDFIEDIPFFVVYDKFEDTATFMQFSNGITSELITVESGEEYAINKEKTLALIFASPMELSVDFDYDGYYQGENNYYRVYVDEYVNHKLKIDLVCHNIDSRINRYEDLQSMADNDIICATHPEGDEWIKVALYKKGSYYKTLLHIPCYCDGPFYEIGSYNDTVRFYVLLPVNGASTYEDSPYRDQNGWNFFYFDGHELLETCPETRMDDLYLYENVELSSIHVLDNEIVFHDWTYRELNENIEITSLKRVAGEFSVSKIVLPTFFLINAIEVENAKGQKMLVDSSFNNCYYDGKYKDFIDEEKEVQVYNDGKTQLLVAKDRYSFSEINYIDLNSLDFSDTIKEKMKVFKTNKGPGIGTPIPYTKKEWLFMEDRDYPIDYNSSRLVIDDGEGRLYLTDDKYVFDYWTYVSSSKKRFF